MQYKQNTTKLKLATILTIQCETDVLQFLSWSSRSCEMSLWKSYNSDLNHIIVTFLTWILTIFCIFTHHQNEQQWGNFGFGDSAGCFRETLRIQTVYTRQRFDTQ